MTDKGEKTGKAGKSPYEAYTERQVRAAFEIFDEDGHGKAKIKHLRTILCALGRVTGTAGLRELESEVEDGNYPNYMLLEGMLNVVTKILLQDRYKSSSLVELRAAFAVLDRGRRGSIDVDSFKKILNEYGGEDREETERLIFEVAGEERINCEEASEKWVAAALCDVEDSRKKIRLELSQENARA